MNEARHFGENWVTFKLWMKNVYTSETLIFKLFCKVLGTKIYRANVGHTNSHEWEEYTFVANSRKFFWEKIQIKLCATEMIIIIIMAIMIIK